MSAVVTLQRERQDVGRLALEVYCHANASYMAIGLAYWAGGDKAFTSETRCSFHRRMPIQQGLEVNHSPTSTLENARQALCCGRGGGGTAETLATPFHALLCSVSLISLVGKAPVG